MAFPIHLHDDTATPRTVDISGLTTSYITSHSKYGDSTSANYINDIDRTLTLTGLASQEVTIEIEYMELDGATTGDCDPDDQLVITAATPAIVDICSDETDGSPYPSYTANLGSNQMSFQFITNGNTEKAGFWIKFSG